MKSSISMPAPLKLLVTSYAEVWIEMRTVRINSPIGVVTSYAEVWIEIMNKAPTFSFINCHLLRGGVD